VLTKDNMYYLKSKKNRKIRGVMSTDFVRVEYMEESLEDSDVRYCIRFIKNLKYCDFIIFDKKSFNQWKINISKNFI